jgi:hypothetical protein
VLRGSKMSEVYLQHGKVGCVEEGRRTEATLGDTSEKVD